MNSFFDSSVKWKPTEHKFGSSTTKCVTEVVERIINPVNIQDRKPLKKYGVLKNVRGYVTNIPSFDNIDDAIVYAISISN